MSSLSISNCQLAPKEINCRCPKWQLRDDRVLKLLLKVDLQEIDFHTIGFPSIGVDKNAKKTKWKTFLNKCLPAWPETRFTVKARTE